MAATSSSNTFTIPPPATAFLEGEPRPVSTTWYQYLVALFKASNSGLVNGITFTPADISGAGLIIHAISCQYTVISGLVHFYGELTYPATADTSHAAITLPIAVPDLPGHQTPCSVLTVGMTVPVMLVPQRNLTTAIFLNQETSANITNAALSGVQVNFMLIYPQS